MLKHVLKIDSQKAIFIAFILFFSYKSWYAMLRVGKFQFTKLASILLIYAFVFLGAYLSKKVRSKLIIFAGVFVLCASAFFITYLLHPNYGSWFFHNADYGIFNSVFYPTAGIYAFLFVLMCDDPEDMRRAENRSVYNVNICCISACSCHTTGWYMEQYIEDRCAG